VSSVRLPRILQQQLLILLYRVSLSPESSNRPPQLDLSRSIYTSDLISLPSGMDETEKFDICGGGGFQHLLRFCFGTFTSS